MSVTVGQQCQYRRRCDSPTVAGGTICQKHLEKRRLYGAKSRENRRNPDGVKAKAEYASKWYKKRLETLKASGLCTACGKVPPAQNLLQCSDCKEKYKKRNQEAYARRKEMLMLERLKSTANMALELLGQLNKTEEVAGKDNDGEGGGDVIMS